MSNNILKTKEEIINEVMELNTLREQLIFKKEKIMQDYCISISPYKIGDKLTDNYGRTIIIKKISPYKHLFEKKYNSGDTDRLNHAYDYEGWQLKKDGTPRKNGYICLWDNRTWSEKQDKKVKEDASNNLQMNEEEIINEVRQLTKRIKQLYLKKDRVIIKYCISISPYKIGDKFIDKYGQKIIIDEITAQWHLFEEQYYYNVPDISNYPFYYRGRPLKQDGTPKKQGYLTAFYDGEQKDIKTTNDGSN
jgi:hypothetical protein